MQKRLNSRSFKIGLAVLITIVWFAVLDLLMEARLQEGLGERLEWIGSGAAAYLFNVLVILSLFLVLVAVTNRWLVSLIVTTVVVVLFGVISYFKFVFLGEPLYPWDLFLYNNVINLLPNLYQQVNMKKLIMQAVILIALIAGLAVWIRLKRPGRLIRFNLWTRLGLLLAGLLVLSGFTFHRAVPQVEAVLKDHFGVFNQPWNQRNNYKENGFFVSFLFNAQSAIVLPPSGYGEKQMKEIIEEWAAGETDGSGEAGSPPNIIMIMNEAFWDPTLLEGVSYTRDPIPTVHEHQSGWLLSPTFGGGTSNVEFEVLTGLSNAFLPSGSVPYQQYIQQTIPALPSYLKNFGYGTLAVHPYPKWFWNREEVYQHFGFDDFIDIDRFENPEYKGPYVGDTEVTREIIRNVERSEDPLFIYAVTMQNHTSYAADRYDEYEIHSESGTVSPGIKGILDTYAQGTADADAALAELMSHFEESDERAVIVFFGDHMPTLGLDYQIYKETGYVPMGNGEEGWELDDVYRMRQTPLVFWNNFGAELPDLEVLSASFVGPHTLEMAGIRQPAFFRFLREFEQTMPGYSRDVKVDDEGDLYRVTPDEVDPLRETYMQIQYDILFGKRYSQDSLFKVPGE
jgi:phosphoglycerol transferase MdoB-like AlkP superfamily enzyme